MSSRDDHLGHFPGLHFLHNQVIAAEDNLLGLPLFRSLAAVFDGSADDRSRPRHHFRRAAVTDANVELARGILVLSRLFR